MEKKNWNIIFQNLIVCLIAVGLAFAVSYGGTTVFGSFPIYGLMVIIAFGIQWIVFIPSFIFKTEKYYDLTGSFTYITVIILSTILVGAFDFRSIIILILVLIWTLRLGLFLFKRIVKAGEDKRFTEMKKSGLEFFRAWNIQGLWVSFTTAAALAALTAPKLDYGIWDWITMILGVLLWILGFYFEALADHQKKKFREDSANQGKFIHGGLWDISRHPNYFGEITLWVGIALISITTLQGWRWFALISPLFVLFLLTKISGLPLLEDYADKKWGGQDDYEEYKKNTPVLIPISFKKKN
ncbi:hypothetical protein NEF87_000583 [Candidatus Lokiarchaeum ossiferum]|uniref:Steroid 5-alpha reductase C-terminal domain-containing protein n=1 Tax=Candidatus Lokiarchaeum ossiferum TaxID=2951803 RepID=A0ABY6HLX3_9ARCH|nr:hypothetical protein NEF87_000583 [Candidatus Lokiarchaeum sp. B-35]